MPPEEDVVTNEFDHGAALSQRDKKIADLQAKINEMQQRPAGNETEQREVIPDNTPASAPDDKSEPPDPVMERLERIEKSLGSFTQNNFDSQFKLHKRVENEEFLEWAKQPLTPLDPDSPTIEAALVNARETGNFKLADSILESYDKKTRSGTDSQSPSMGSAPQSAEQKKTIAKIADLEKERQQAYSRRDDAKVRELTDSIRKLKS